MQNRNPRARIPVAPEPWRANIPEDGRVAALALLFPSGAQPCSEEQAEPAANRRLMARRKRKRPLRPRVPARVRKRTKRARSHHESELIGLALGALGLVLSAILYLGFDGGAVGSWLAGALDSVFGSAAYMLPLVLVAIGGLMLARSELLDVRPFRLGLGVGFLGLMTLLAKDSGGWIGLALAGALAALIGETGAAIVGGTLLVAGALLVSGASTGAILRHTGHVVRQVGTEARRAFDRVSSESQTGESAALAAEPEEPPPRRLLDGAEAFPDVVGAHPSGGAAAPRPRGDGTRAREHGERVRDLLGAHRVPASGSRDPPSLACSRGNEHGRRRARRRPARADARRVRHRRDRDRPDLGSACDALRAAARPGNEGLEGRGSPRRPLLRARDDGDQDPRADPREAGRRRRGAEPLPAARHPRRHLRRPAGDREPARRLARQGHLRERDLDRSRAHAAPPDRGDDRLRQVRLHQHDPELDPRAGDAGRSADDPDRPEAHRARLLRVDSAPSDVGRFQPEGGGHRTHERGRRDGAPLRAAVLRPRPQPARGEPRAPARVGRRRSRTCSSSSTSSPT